MPIRTITVSTAAQLTAALSTATGGETILLNPGNYGAMTLNRYIQKFDFTYDSQVTIRSADTGRPAVFTSMDIRGATNLSFEKVTFDYTLPVQGEAVWAMPFKISGGANMSFDGCLFDGDTIKVGDASNVGYASGAAFLAGGVSGLTFSNNEVRNFYRGVAVGGSEDVVLSGNNIHTIRMDGINVSSTQGIVIENNYIHDFKRAPIAAEHSDMIQFWTTGTTRPSTDIVIRNNLLDIGNGDNTQSIFMRNELVDTGQAGQEMYYRNVLIEQNTIYNDHQHGITLGATAGAVIRNNAVLHADGRIAGPTGNVSIPIISVATASTDVSITDNVTSRVNVGLTPPAGWEIDNNLLVQDQDATAPNHYSDHFVGNTVDGLGTRHSFLALPGGVIETSGVGPDRLQIDKAPAVYTPIFHVGTKPGDESTFVFDAANFSNGPGGPITAEQGRFLWTFGDGTTAEGGVVSHKYAKPGDFTVTLKLEQPSGTTTTFSDQVRMLSADLLRFDSRTGRFGVVDNNVETMLSIDAGLLGGTSLAKTIKLGIDGAVAKVPYKMIDDIFGGDNFSIDLRLQADTTQPAYGGVFRMHNFFIGSVDKTGNFAFNLSTADGSSVTLVTKGATLLDGKSHAVSIRYDADVGILKVIVDGKFTAQTGLTSDLAKMGNWDLVFSSLWGGKSFDGTVSHFDLNVDRSLYPTYSAPEQSVSPQSARAALADTGPHLAAHLDDYVFASTVLAKLPAAQLRDEAHVAVEDGRKVLSFDGIGDRALIGKLAQFEHSDRLAVEVDFQRDVANGRSGTLVANDGQIQLNVVNDGFRLRVATADEGMKTYTITKLGLNDTDWHNAVVIVDAVADRLQVFLDDKMVFEDSSTDLVMTAPEGGTNGWVLGSTFDGQIAEFRVDDDIGHQFASVGDRMLFA